MDVLDPLSASRRIECIAGLTDARVYHEARNVLKHRAQKAAYRRAVAALRDEAGWTARDRLLLATTKDHLTYEDYLRGRRANLYEVLLASEAQPQTPPDLVPPSTGGLHEHM